VPVAAPRLRRTANELELSLSAEAARQLGTALRQSEADLVTLVEGPAAPYDEWLSRIIVHRTESGRVLMRVDEDASALVLQGEQRFLGTLAENIEGFVNDEPGSDDHLHIEHYEDHYYLAPSQVSLVVVADDDR
jgi:hypothetical protein